MARILDKDNADTLGPSLRTGVAGFGVGNSVEAVVVESFISTSSSITLSL
ncbi:hypothetical protein [Flavobacterium cellulosilyticum]|nr:hypothetical protein [Flavobacterium cellulosilyticum]